jgi:hypothetical protein
MSTEADREWDNNDEVSGEEGEQEIIDPPGFVKSRDADDAPPKLDRRRLTSKENMRKAQTLRAQKAREEKARREAAEKIKQMYYNVHQDEEDEFDFEQLSGEDYDEDTVKAVKEYLKEQKRQEQKGKGKSSSKQRYPESESESEEDSAEEYVITKKSSKIQTPRPTYKAKKKDSYADYLKYVNPLMLMSKLSTKEAKKQREESKKEEKAPEPVATPVPKPQLQNTIASELKRKIIDM